MNFSPAQTQAYACYQRGQNLFLTGPGGSGKSTLLKKIYRDCSQRIQVCAMTGCAALLLECRARTVHSFSGIGLGTGTIKDNVLKVSRSRYKTQAWRALDVLVIDEVSMMSKKMFGMLDAIAKHTRKNDRPFGGLQVIFSGDFYQLSPIGNHEDPDTMAFCFEHENWNLTFPPESQISLVKIFRQNNDEYVHVLHQVRVGQLDRASREILMAQVNKPVPAHLVIRPTRLLPTRSKVDATNRQEMSKLPTKEREMILQEHLDLPMTSKENNVRQRFSKEDVDREFQFLRGNLLCESVLRLREGAQVMCVVNKELTDESRCLCNGSQGVVVGFEEDYPRVRFQNGVETVMFPHVWQSETIPGIGVSQVPLILAWAITIHKSQGASLDCAEIDVGSSIFECGQTYVALSRIKSLDGLYLTSFDPDSILVHPKVHAFYETLR